MSQQSLGEKLRELRESKGLSREQLYSQTKIHEKYIEALETGRWDLLPGKAYLKPFVKNIATVLGADYREYYQLINSQIQKKKAKEAEAEAEPDSKGFDYRWLAVLLLIALVAIIVYVLKPLEQTEQPEPIVEDAPVVVEQTNNHAILERDYSSAMDISGMMFEGMKLHRMEVTAIDSAWIRMTSAADGDTLYSGLLMPGQRVVRESLDPFVLFVGRINTVSVNYNGIDVPREGILSESRLIDFSKIDIQSLEGGE